MMTKQQYIEYQVEGAFEDTEYIKKILKEYFTKEVKIMTNGEFKDHLKSLNLLELETKELKKWVIAMI